MTREIKKGSFKVPEKQKLWSIGDYTFKFMTN